MRFQSITEALYVVLLSCVHVPCQRGICNVDIKPLAIKRFDRVTEHREPGKHMLCAIKPNLYYNRMASADEIGGTDYTLSRF